MFLKVLNNIHLVKENVSTMFARSVWSLKGSVLNCCKLEIAFKCQTRLSNSFHYKDSIPKDLISSVVFKFQCGLCKSLIMAIVSDT